MMGKNHFISGGITGGVYCSLLGVPLIETPVIIVIVMFFALVPDVDCPGSTVTRDLWIIGRPISWFIRRLSHVVYEATKGPRDEDWEGTHRHLSHTVVFALVMGGGLFAATSPFTDEHSALVLGGAAALGCWTHCLGDSLTVMGCPWLWPLPIAGETWYEIRTPRLIRFHTGSGVEHWFSILVLYPGAVLAFPGAWAIICPLMVELAQEFIQGLTAQRT